MSRKDWILTKQCWICERWNKLEICVPKAQIESLKNSQNSSQSSKSGLQKLSNATKIKGEVPQKQKFLCNVSICSNKTILAVRGSFTRGGLGYLKLNSDDSLYVYKEYIPFGPHNYRLLFLDNGKEQSVLESRFVHKPRDQALPIRHWQVEGLPRRTRTFAKERSVFRDYRLDNPEVYRRCFEADWRYNKVPKLIRRPEEVLIIKDQFHSCWF